MNQFSRLIFQNYEIICFHETNLFFVFFFVSVSPATPPSPLQPQWGVLHREQPGVRPLWHHGGGRGRSLLRDAAGGGPQAQHQLPQYSQGTHWHTSQQLEARLRTGGGRERPTWERLEAGGGRVGLSDKFSLGSPIPSFCSSNPSTAHPFKAELKEVALNNRTKPRKAELLSFLISLQSILKPQMQPNRPWDASGWD